MASQPKTESTAQSPVSSHAHPEQLFSAVNSVASQLQMIEKFIARRFDEISMEINATSQQVDMAEEGIAKRFSEILEVLKAVSYSGDGTTAANAGVELDAVVEMTEQAANRILDAADRITTRIHAAQENGGDVNSALAEIDQDVEEIFMACSFQDITGQRIRKTLENLKMVEERLSTALDKMGIKIDADPLEHTAIKNKLSSQDDIDSFFNESKSRG
jgi:chemotaxis protein CheZ